MRYEVVYRGKVQGIGFRANAHELARERKVVGWIRNEPDGSVKLVIEGPEAALDAYIESLRERVGENIADVHLQTDMEERGYEGFEIRY